MNSDRINELRMRYKRSLAEKAEMLETLSAKIPTQMPVSEEMQSEIHEFLHKLAGSSGMYGYQDIAELSRAALTELEKQQLPALTEQLVQIRNLLQQHA